jgi:hypothetical protein
MQTRVPTWKKALMGLLEGVLQQMRVQRAERRVPGRVLMCKMGVT